MRSSQHNDVLQPMLLIAGAKMCGTAQQVKPDHRVAPPAPTAQQR
jgi:hypothetical protein